MLFADVVDSIGTTIELKRISSAYVIDYRNLSTDEIKDALKKTAPQYSHQKNVTDAIHKIMLHPDRNHRIISFIMLKNVLLNKDNFAEKQKRVNENVIDYEKQIINDSDEMTISKQDKRSEQLDLLKFILETAWENNDDISPDEKNLLEKIKHRLLITDHEYQLLEAQIGRFPKSNNEVHTAAEVEDVRRYLQNAGLLFSIRDSDRTDYDIIPDEVALTLREIFGIELREHGYQQLLDSRFIKSKSYLVNTLGKGNIEAKQSMKFDELKQICLERVKPSILIGGYSTYDGLNGSELSKWCKSLELPSSGQKGELIQRIIDYYDGVYEKAEALEDPRANLVNYFEDLSNRNLEELRKQGIIKKDIECERLFEQATDYLFENFLNHKPLLQKGTEHPDGILSFQNKFILWDNKSKESPVNLADHIKQFDRYIKNSEKAVASFLVIGPDFTDNSQKECLKYSALNETTICLIKAKDLKALALQWSDAMSEDDKSFPLGYFRQNGLFDSNLIDIN